MQNTEYTTVRKTVHVIAGTIGFLTIAIFWFSTLTTELIGSHAAIASVKQCVLWGMVVLIPAMAVAGASGMSLGRGRAGHLVDAKKRRMPIIGLNGLLILVPSAVFLSVRAQAGTFDDRFYAVQAVELIAGAVNLLLMGLNIRDGLRLSGRLTRARLSK